MNTFGDPESPGCPDSVAKLGDWRQVGAVLRVPRRLSDGRQHYVLIDSLVVAG